MTTRHNWVRGCALGLIIGLMRLVCGRSAGATTYQDWSQHCSYRAEFRRGKIRLGRA